MKTHILKIREADKVVFEAIQSGEKNIETRAATDRYRAVQNGDILVFVCGNKRFEKEVKEVETFKKVEDLNKRVNFKDVVPFARSAEEMKQVLFSFPGNEEKIRKCGLIAFWLR